MGPLFAVPIYPQPLLQFRRETINVSFLSQGFDGNLGLMFCFYVTLSHTGDILIHQYDTNNEINEIVTGQFIKQKNANILWLLPPISRLITFLRFSPGGYHCQLRSRIPQNKGGWVPANVQHGVPPQGPKCLWNVLFPLINCFSLQHVKSLFSFGRGMVWGNLFSCWLCIV